MVVFRRLRIFLPAVAHPREEGHYNNTYLLQEWMGQKVEAPHDGRPLALVHNQWTGTNFYHWLVDALPRLVLLQASHPTSRLVMPTPIAGFVRESAAALGFKELLPLEAGQTLVNADLLVPDHVTAPGYQHPALLQQVRTQLLAGLCGSEPLSRPHRRVYASRRSQRVRRLLNEEAIEAILGQYGYELIEFEKFSFVEQIKLMTETERFVSIHGAGLTNMLFLPPAARVGELLNMDKMVVKQNKDFENLIYFRMASALQLPYYCLPCAAAGYEPLVNEAHIRVDVAAFEQLLRRMDE
jgi:capsular polysaccharide biosynthesis protein